MEPNRTTPDERGFTLVELLVVIAILALAASAVVLSMNPSEDMPRREASRLAGKLTGLRDQAIVENRPLGAWVEPGTYGFERWQDDEWVAIDADPLRDTVIDEGVRINVGGRTLVRFDAVGMPAAPVTLRFEEEGDTPASLSVTAHGEVTVR